MRRKNFKKRKTFLINFIYVLSVILVGVISGLLIKDNDTKVMSLSLFGFGCIFFFAGCYVNDPIFLISHGLTGYSLILASLLVPVFKSPLYSDNPVHTKMYMLFVIVSCVMTFIYNFILCLKKNNERPFTNYLFIKIFYLLSLILAALTQYLMQFIY